jgi:hypothetical protein
LGEAISGVTARRALRLLGNFGSGISASDAAGQKRSWLINKRYPGLAEMREDVPWLTDGYRMNQRLGGPFGNNHINRSRNAMNRTTTAAAIQSKVSRIRTSTRLVGQF